MSGQTRSILASDFVLKLATNQIASSLNSEYGVNHDSDHWNVEALRGRQGGRWSALGIELKNINSQVKCHLAMGVDTSLNLRMNELHNSNDGVYIGIRVSEENELDLRNSRQSVYEEFKDVLTNWNEPHKYWSIWKIISFEENLNDDDIEKRIISEYVDSFKTLRDNRNV